MGTPQKPLQWMGRIGLVLGFVMTANGTLAQSAANGTAFEDWTLMCRAEAVGRTACGLVQRITVEESGAFVAEIGLNLVEIEGEPRVLMVLQTPSAMFLPVRPGFQVNGQDEVVALDWRTCAGDFCTATRVLDESELTALQAGDAMMVGYQPATSSDAINFPSSLAGVTAGLLALSP